MVIGHLAPHAGARLAEAVLGRGRVQRDWQAQLRQHEAHLGLEVGESLEVDWLGRLGRLGGFGIRFDGDAGLVGEDDEDIADLGGMELVRGHDEKEFAGVKEREEGRRGW